MTFYEGKSRQHDGKNSPKMRRNSAKTPPATPELTQALTECPTARSVSSARSISAAPRPPLHASSNTGHGTSRWARSPPRKVTRGRLETGHHPSYRRHVFTKMTE